MIIKSLKFETKQIIWYLLSSSIIQYDTNQRNTYIGKCIIFTLGKHNVIDYTCRYILPIISGVVIESSGPCPSWLYQFNIKIKCYC